MVQGQAAQPGRPDGTTGGHSPGGSRLLAVWAGSGLRFRVNANRTNEAYEPALHMLLFNFYLGFPIHSEHSWLH